MRCPSCQSPIPENGRFCPACGAEADAAGMREVRKTVTVLFCDMTDSTAMSERLDAEILREVMAHYFVLMRDCLVRQGGTVEKFVGDAVMAVFGIPVVHEDDPLRAVCAAVDMQAALRELNEELSRIADMRINIRIGINTGEVVTSVQPGGGQGLVAGSAVNVAARLEQRAGPGEVLLGPQTEKAISSVAITDPVGSLRLKGITGRIVAHRLVQVLDPGSGVMARHLDAELIGRVDELSELDLVLERSIRDYARHLITLYGDAGVGKSRLSAEYEEAARRRGAIVAAGRCQALGDEPSLLPLADALRPLMSAAFGDGALALDDDTRQAIISLRSGMLRDGAPGSLVAEAVWAVRQLLESLGRNQPVLMIFDDLHWAHPVLLDVIMQLAGQLRDTMVVLLCIARTDFLTQWPSWADGLPNVKSVLLGPLSTRDIRTLVDQLSDVVAHDQSMSDTIVERAEGNPLFAEQLVAILEDGADPGTLPSTVSLLLAARLDLLAAGERALLCAAAVIGRDFTLKRLRAISDVVGGPADDTLIDEMLSGLSRRRLIQRGQVTTSQDVTWRFGSTAVREVAYESLPKRTRATLHQRLADWLEAGADQTAAPAVIAEAIATHLEQAYLNLENLGAPGHNASQLGKRAAEHLVSVGVGALRRSDVQRAVNLLGRGLLLYQDDDLALPACTEQLAEARIAAGDVEAGVLLMKDSLEAAVQAGDRLVAAHARLQLAYLEQPTDQLAASLAAARSALPVFQLHHDELGLARAWTRIGQARQADGRFLDAADMLERALGHAIAADAELERATALGALAMSWWQGPADVPQAIGRCRALLEEHSRTSLAVRAALSCPLAVLLATAGEIEQARKLGATAQKIIKDIGHAYAAATVPIFQAAIEACAGEWPEAERLLRDADQLCQALGDAQLRVTAGSDLARAFLWQGKYDEALDLAATISGAVTQLTPTVIAGLRGVTAQVLAIRGQHVAARRFAEESLTVAGRTDSLTCQATALLDLASVLIRAGNYRAGRATAERARTAFLHKGHMAGRHWAEHLLVREVP